MVSETNIPNFSMMREHEHKNADTLLILHCHDVAKRYPNSEFVVFSPDTDFYLLLIHDLAELMPCTLFRTGRGNQLRNITISKCYEIIGPVKATKLLGFYALAGCDQNERLNGKTKSFW